jgi:3'(2'), 5'-bisphosphate nucleotidase
VKALHRHLLTAMEAAEDAGREILAVYNGPFTVETKADDSPLTAADRAAHAVITARLGRDAAGQLPVLSEEGRDTAYAERRHWEAFWLVDPLDGTKEFVNRNGEFTVNIALIRRGRTELGVVHLPVKRRFYLAAAGLGAWRLDGHPADALAGAAAADPAAGIDALCRSARRLPLPAVETNGGETKILKVAGSRSHPSVELDAFLAEKRAKGLTIDFIAAGSALKFCLVAEGSAQLYPRFGPTMEWDSAAGQAVVEQAGGRVLAARTGRPLTYNKEDLHNPWFIVHAAGC